MEQPKNPEHAEAVRKALLELKNQEKYVAQLEGELDKAREYLSTIKTRMVDSVREISPTLAKQDPYESLSDEEIIDVFLEMLRSLEPWFKEEVKS